MIRLKIIKSPGESCRNILKTRIREYDSQMYGAVGLVQGMIYEILYAADVAEKAANVVVYDIKGNCPQTLTTIAVLGNIEDVETALRAIKEKADLGEIDD